MSALKSTLQSVIDARKRSVASSRRTTSAVATHEAIAASTKAAFDAWRVNAERMLERQSAAHEREFERLLATLQATADGDGLSAAATAEETSGVAAVPPSAYYHLMAPPSLPSSSNDVAPLLGGGGGAATMTSAAEAAFHLWNFAATCDVRNPLLRI